MTIHLTSNERLTFKDIQETSMGKSSTTRLLYLLFHFAALSKTVSNSTILTSERLAIIVYS